MSVISFISGNISWAGFWIGAGMVLAMMVYAERH